MAHSEAFSYKLLTVKPVKTHKPWKPIGFPGSQVDPNLKLKQFTILAWVTDEAKWRTQLLVEDIARSPRSMTDTPLIGHRGLHQI